MAIHKSKQKWYTPYFTLWVTLALFVPVLAYANENPLSVNLDIRVLLAGAYDEASGLMRDDLRRKNRLPSQQPYNNDLVSYFGTETISKALLDIEGDNAPVDWVLLELRSASDSGERLAAGAFLVQRDGDLVNSQTGVSTLAIPNVADGNYYLVLRHRNHLSVMTKNLVALSSTTTLIDFTAPSTLVYGDHARYESGDVAFLWPGDADSNGTVIDSGPGNDKGKLLQDVLLASGNDAANSNFISQTYLPSDFDLDGSVIFTGPDNDTNLLTGTVLLHPENLDFLSNYVVREQVPEITTDSLSPPEQNLVKPNILLIISDDQGLDASTQYSLTNNPPNTPRINALANSGLVFENAWATPGCTTTRSSIITGKYGVNSGVTAIADILPATETVLHKYLAQTNATSDYNSSIIGKWHLGGANPPATEPNDRGIPYYAGILQGSLADYSDWEVTEQGEKYTTTEYSTSKLTDLAVNWVSEQGANPWFLWLAYNAPHTPFHLPPADLQTTSLSGNATDIAQNPRDYYLAAIEAMDTEIGRLLDSMPQAVRDNTLILYVGDNGTPSKVRDKSVYAKATKATLSEGGLRVPMIASGYGVTRKGERESALINVPDFFATIADVSGAGISQIHDSVSFKPLFTDGSASQRNEVYVDFNTGTAASSGYAIKNSQYKYLRFDDGSEALYDLLANPAEDNNLIGSSTAADETATSLRALASAIRGEETTTPVPPPSNTSTDITDAIFTERSANCADYVQQFTSMVRDVGNATVFNGEVSISTDNSGKCVISANGIPNHDFNDLAGFPNNVTTQSYRYEITASPTFAGSTTELFIGTDNGIMLNGAKLDLLAAACHGVGNEQIGCGNGNDWRFDPMSEHNAFKLDSHNAHTQPNGSYHYHGNPNALFSDQAVESPLIGFAADGFPIFGSWFNDNGTVRKATSGYRVKSGSRPTANGAPGGTYDGTFRDDYEYVNGLGDLDECNGMTQNGAYGYYVIDEFPYVMKCFKGTVDASF